MGIIRENINFERGRDPKESMDLGLVGLFNKFKEDHFFGPSTSKNWMLVQAIREKRLDLITYMIDVLEYDVNGGNYLPLISAAVSKDKKLCQLLIDRGANVEETLDLLDENIFKKETNRKADLKKAFNFLLKNFDPEGI